MKVAFAPTALVGLASGVAAAVFGGRQLAGGERSSDVLSTTGAVGTLPLAQALALVALAAWGVLLVARGVARRVAAGLAALAAGGTVVVLALGAEPTTAAVRQRLEELGVPGEGVGLTPSYWVAVVAATVCLVASVLALFSAGSWPEMGRRYDAPSAADGPADPASSDPTDLWRVLDEGHDPTAGPTP